MFPSPKTGIYLLTFSPLIYCKLCFGFLFSPARISSFQLYTCIWRPDFLSLRLSRFVENNPRQVTQYVVLKNPRKRTQIMKRSQLARAKYDDRSMQVAIVQPRFNTVVIVTVLYDIAATSTRLRTTRTFKFQTCDISRAFSVCQ